MPNHTNFLFENLKRPPKKTFYILIALAIVATAVIMTIVKYRNSVYIPLDKNNTTNTSIIIKKGLTVREIGDILEEKEIIDSSSAFYWYVRLNSLDKDIVSGRFLLNPSMNVPEILAKISDVSKSEAVITIVEGNSIKDIDKKLAETGLTKEGDFIAAVKTFNGYENYPFLDKKLLAETQKATTANMASQKSADYLPLEGYLYPDTYFLEPVNFDPNDLIIKALNNFSKKITPYLQEIQTSNKKLQEILTMASIIEKEVIGDKDRKMVSGILWKRLASGWRLDADATLLYITNDKKITKDDLNIDSLYNTRKNKGLPPGPICNPSISSIEASIHPTPSDYFFYLTSKDGETKYAKTNDEKNQNREKYL